MFETMHHYCIECRKETPYVLKKKEITKVIREEECTFTITIAQCAECGSEMNVPGLIDLNVKEIDAQYRKDKNLVTMEDIEKLMKIYHIGKAPLSLALGFGEITINRYLAGQLPSEEYSDVIRKALTCPAFMKGRLMKNKEKIAGAAYHKAMDAISSLESLFCLSDKMLMVISCLFDEVEEVTPLMLQKLLYFTQGLSFVVLKRPLFEEDCQAWVHGPVYPKAYQLFKNFSYNPIDDARFSLLENAGNGLTKKEKEVVHLVSETFGLYSGKVLEQITHNERPWKKARSGLTDDLSSDAVIPQSEIRSYFEKVNQKYSIHTREGVLKYIDAMRF